MKAFITTCSILVLLLFPETSTSQETLKPPQPAEAVKTEKKPEIVLGLEKIYAEAIQYQQDGNLGEAAKLFTKLENQKPGFKDVAARLTELRQKEKVKPTSSISDQHYLNGLAALKKENWTKAIIAFKKVKEINPDYPGIAKKQKEAEAGLARDSSVDIVARYYGRGLRALNQDKLKEAKSALQKVIRLNSDYRNARSLMQEIDERLAEINGGRNPRLFAGIDSLYQNAQKLLAISDWAAAIGVLLELQSLQPNYKNTPELLSLAREKQRQTTSGSSRLTTLLEGRLRYFGAIGVAAMGIPFLMLLIFSPTAKARLYLMRGNYLKAAETYEKLLSRHPERLKLYQRLGNLYLLIGQTDKKSVKVFKTILQLNLNTSNRQQLQTIIKQYYLEEKKDAPEAIDILEKALKEEQEKQPENQGEQEA